LANDKRLPYAEYLSVQFPRGAIYSEQAALQLLRLLEKQVKARQRSDAVVVTPSRIILIFERMKGDEILKKYFGFFAFPIGIDLTYGSYKEAHSGRRNPGFILERFRSAVACKPRRRK
jgi:hypothetical protein